MSKGPANKKQALRGKGQKKKMSLKFTIDCTHPAEDSIMDVANFVSLLNIYADITSDSALYYFDT